MTFTSHNPPNCFSWSFFFFFANAISISFSQILLNKDLWQTVSTGTSCVHRINDLSAFCPSYPRWCPEYLTGMCTRFGNEVSRQGTVGLFVCYGSKQRQFKKSRLHSGNLFRVVLKITGFPFLNSFLLISHPERPVPIAHVLLGKRHRHKRSTKLWDGML